MKRAFTARHLTRLLLFTTLLFAFSAFSQASPTATPLSDQEMQSLQGGHSAIYGYVLYKGISISSATVSASKVDSPYYYYQVLTGANGYYMMTVVNGCYAVTASAYSRPSCTKKVCVPNNSAPVNFDLAYCSIFY